MADKKNEQVEILKDALEQLELLVNLSALRVASEKSITEASRQLKMAGLDNQTIANVLNTTPETVRAVTSNLRVKRLRLGKRRR